MGVVEKEQPHEGLNRMIYTLVIPIYPVLEAWIGLESYQCRIAVCGQHNMGFLSAQRMSAVVLAVSLADSVKSGKCIKHDSPCSS